MPDEDLLATNNLGITDLAALYAVERDLSALRAIELVESPVAGDFDLPHLQAIHHHLFQDVYEWAGELRTVSLSKGNLFALPQFIESEANKLFANLANEQHLVGLGRGEFVERTAFYLGEINALHPFREGNGRTQRAFIDQLVAKNDYAIDWTQITAEDNIDASRESMNGDNRLLVDLIDRALVNMRDLHHAIEDRAEQLAQSATMALGQQTALYASNGGSYRGPIIAIVDEIALQRVAPGTVIAHDNRILGLQGVDASQAVQINGDRAEAIAPGSDATFDRGR